MPTTDLSLGAAVSKAKSNVNNAPSLCENSLLRVYISSLEGFA
jgi:hypothetical protein